MSLQQVDPKLAWEILATDKNSLLVDVRTNEELNSVGYPDLSAIKAKSVVLAWRFYPNMELNTNFISELSNFVANNFSDNPLKTNLLFLCRSGGRSFDAAQAMSDIGYNTYNIIGGFEGAPGHQGNINGWKAANLPWEI